MSKMKVFCSSGKSRNLDLALRALSFTLAAADKNARRPASFSAHVPCTITQPCEIHDITSGP